MNNLDKDINDMDEGKICYNNREYEIEENDGKRNILVVPKNRLSNIEKDIENRLA
jgi:hypothetical protein